ncbi:DNA-binding transcriptional ArsR family regulator [Bradyrhizobium sp. USDA 4524]|uniref:Transcriptional regulator, ArsR family n=1 Tax=Bradyrhizobium brasilense TaxID=1419277 RepID=A0A1G6NCH8_9BRAD|nr:MULTISPECIES: metalloregulator ArsR/SmtB family transcription factor [Bradyrhizobium]MCP1912190.1 DNA-binding transcriptional ArsR family regulator [Bradyrhizobium elkanii]MCA1397520.1 winged helix-turn-helix transcriptional regulator [Bradyrhizobium sp. BRP56]MCA6101496.1 winged helix-turn-helix transcriptional regulator [Bradyrhizobium australafricanum]MCC8976115.1 winged helix-turn-helix transcriptional regulator [Bradyrhizobium brasilense]MCP1841351.1 DNA-binding transcriptional ArsR fa
MISAERALDALGDPTRRMVFKRLREGNRSVQEIADGLKVSRPAVSQHLRVLKDAGLAVVRIEGTRRLYAIDTRGLESLRGWLDGFWDKTLTAFKQAAEREAAKERRSR